jgi:uncharacterized protein YjbJ (UPF0337 family)
MFNHVSLVISRIQAIIGKTVAAAVFLALLLLTQALPVDAATILPILSIGAKHQAEGALQQGIGKAEHVTGELKGKTAGLARQADGKAKRDVGRVESKAEEFANSNGRKATDLGEQIQDAAGSFADSVKDLVK